MISGSGPFDFITGGGKSMGPFGKASKWSPSDAPTAPDISAAVSRGLFGRLGIKRVPRPDNTYGYDYGAMPTGKVTPEEARRGYDFKPLEEAVGRMGTYSPFAETYKSSYAPSPFSSGYKSTPYQKAKFDFQGLPEQHMQEQFELGSKPLIRAGASELGRLKETIGPRRPGLLLKAGEQSQRNLGEQLAEMQTRLRGQAAEKKVDLGVQQQIQQASEDYQAAGFSEQQAVRKAEEDYRSAQFGEEQARYGAGERTKEFESRAQRESREADERFRRDTGLGEISARKIGLESDLTERERAAQDKLFDDLMKVLGISMGGQQFEDTLKGSKQSATIGALGSIGGGFAGGGFGKIGKR